jgi:protocatechuate 3,4-dioxygenase beta subunit
MRCNGVGESEVAMAQRRPDDRDDHDRGLAFDVATMMSRRHALGVLAGIGVVAIAGCGSGDSSSSASTGSSASTATSATSSASTSAAGSTSAIPEETAGPFPGDGSNGPDALTEQGIVRRDIRSSFGNASGTAAGIPLTLALTVLDHANGAPLRGGAVYVWHCDRDGNYSMYSQAAADQNYLRGVQQTNAEGKVTFTTIFPGAYAGRWPHIHFEVYPSLDEATRAGTKTATSQLALPKQSCELAYAQDGYEQSLTNLAQTSLARDMVFSDGYSTQLATVGGTVARGMTATLTVPV